MLEACVEDLMLTRNAFPKEETDNEFYQRIRARKQQRVDNGKLLITQLEEMIEKDRFWLGRELLQIATLCPRA